MKREESLAWTGVPTIAALLFGALAVPAAAQSIRGFYISTNVGLTLAVRG